MRFRPRLSATPAVLALALGAVLSEARPAQAAWDNVFQVCCNSCGGAQRSASFFAPAPAPSACPTCPQTEACAPACPQPQMRVSYVQRCYYQPVTEYQRQSYYEPVKSTYTSYYYEPTTSYRYTTYYDPCTGCPQRVCTPVTSYQMRSKCNSVTSYVQRCAMVPVTTLKPVTFQQPVVSYYYPPTQACAPACDSGSAALPSTTPSVEQIRSNPPAVLPPAAADSNIPPTTVPTTPGMSYPKTLPPATSAPSNVRLRPERTTSLSNQYAVRGEVVMNDQVTPRPNVKVVFVDASNAAKREYATANAYGEFDVRLPAGKWYLYVGGADGKATYHKQVTIGDRDTYDFRLVSR